MHKRKRPNRSEGNAPAADSGIIKKPFKTRPLTKKKAKAKLQANKQDTSQTNTTVLDKSALQWRSHTEQSEWLTSTFQSVFGTLLSPSELEPISGTLLHHPTYVIKYLEAILGQLLVVSPCLMEVWEQIHYSFFLPLGTDLVRSCLEPTMGFCLLKGLGLRFHEALLDRIY